MKKLRIPAIAAALLTLLLVGCSESDGPDNPNNQENSADNSPMQSVFQLTPDDLNTYLPDANTESFSNEYLRGGDGVWLLRVNVTPAASRSFSFFHDNAFIEVPACGGEYKIETRDLAYLQKVALIEGIDVGKLEDKSVTNLHLYYYELTEDIENENPAYSIAIAELNDNLEIEDRSFGEVVDYNLNGDAPFYTYRFPENHTGEYRIFALYGYHLCRPPFWEMFDPDMKPTPTFTPIFALQYPD